MTEPTNDPTASWTLNPPSEGSSASAQSHGDPSRGRSIWRRRWMLLTLPLLGVGALFLSRAYAHGGGGLGGPFGMQGGSEEKMEAFMERKLSHILGRLDATPDQEKKIKAVMESLRPELQGLRAERHQLRRECQQVLSAVTIDPTAIEQMRQKHSALMDKMSRVVSRGINEIAPILTLQQREKIVAFMERHGR